MVRSRVTTSVGGGATFEVRTSNVEQPSYQWCRAPHGANTCEAIPGATGPSYTVTGANLADDDAVYQVTVGGGWLPATAAGRLAPPWRWRRGVEGGAGRLGLVPRGVPGHRLWNGGRRDGLSVWLLVGLPNTADPHWLD